MSYNTKEEKATNKQALLSRAVEEHRRHEEKAMLKAVYFASPYFLGRDILGYTKFCETQIDWSDKLTRMFNPNEPQRTWSLVLAPRETLKSTFWTVTATIWLLLNNPNLTILIASETISNAEAFLKEIRGKLLSEAFVNLFGNIISPLCNRADALDLVTRKNVSKEANIETAGLGKSITGRHYDVVFMDDIAGVADRDSEAKRKMTLNFFGDIMDVLKKERGFLNVVGTRWHRDDIYAHIIDRVAPDLQRKHLGRFHIIEKPAHHPKTQELNYPRLLPESRLQELRTVKQGKDGVDITTYMAQYELMPLAPGEQIFKSFHYYDPAVTEYDLIVQWTDPALSDKSSACYSAIVAVGKLRGQSGKWGVCYASLAKRAPTVIIRDHNRIARMLKEMYKCEVVAFMEDNGFQMLLRNEAVAKSADDGEEVATLGRVNTENKDARIRSLEPFVSQGFLLFRSDWATAPEGYNILMEQLSSFPQGMKDGPDALQCAHKQTQSRYMT